jgi:hypothetical protein
MYDIWDKVCDQIAKDIAVGDVTAIYEMLQQVPKDVLIAYLPEEEVEDV